MSGQKKPAVFTKNTSFNQLNQDGRVVDIMNLTMTLDQVQDLIADLSEEVAAGGEYVQLAFFTDDKVNKQNGKTFKSTNIKVSAYTPKPQQGGAAQAGGGSSSRFVPKGNISGRGQNAQAVATNRADRVRRSIES